jgi:cytochrome c oxidase assembly factor CtaG
MNTNKKHYLTPIHPILLIFSLTVSVALAVLPLTLEEFVMQLSLPGQKFFYNFFYFASALFSWSTFLLIYWFPLTYDRLHKDLVRRYCPLIGALFLLGNASYLFYFYDGSIKAFNGMYSGLKLDEKVMITSLVENLGTLKFIVPAVMLGVAINLITEFLKTSSPLKHSN